MCWLYYTNLRNKTQYRRAVHLSQKSSQDLKKVSISILFEKVCLGWKLSPIINRRGGWNKNVLGRKKVEKLISGVRRLSRTQEALKMGMSKINLTKKTKPYTS